MNHIADFRMSSETDLSQHKEILVPMSMLES